MAHRRRRQWTAQRLLDGDSNGRREQRLLDGNGRCNGSSTARDGASAAAVDREHNGDGQRWTARWRIEGDGGRGTTARDGATATATRRRGTAQW